MKLIPKEINSGKHERPEKSHPAFNPAQGFLRRELLGPSAKGEGPAPAFESSPISHLFHYGVKQDCKPLRNLHLSTFVILPNRSICSHTA
jgi:hypothetical protein